MDSASYKLRPYSKLAQQVGYSACTRDLRDFDRFATVYALDRLPESSPYFYTVQKRAAETLGCQLHYRQIDVRDVPKLNEVIGEIADKHARLDGLLAAAGIQQEVPALDYTAEDARAMVDVNIVGTMMTAQAAARQMIKYGNPGSIALIASMSGSVANRNLLC